MNCEASVISTAFVLFSVACVLILYLARLEAREREREGDHNARLKSRLNRLENVTTDLLHAVRLLQPTSEMCSQQPELDTTLAKDTATEKRKPTAWGDRYSRDAGSQPNPLKNWAVCHCSAAVQLPSTPPAASRCADRPRGSPVFCRCKLGSSPPRMRHALSGTVPRSCSSPTDLWPIDLHSQDRAPTQDLGFARTTSAGPPQGHNRSKRDIYDASSSSPHRQSSSEEGAKGSGFVRAVSTGHLLSNSTRNSRLAGKKLQHRPSQRLQDGNVAGRVQGSNSSDSLSSSIQHIHNTIKRDLGQQEDTNIGYLCIPPGLSRSKRFDKQFAVNTPVLMHRASSGTVPTSCPSPTDSRNRSPSRKHSSIKNSGSTRTTSDGPSQGDVPSPNDSGFKRTTSAGPPRSHKNGTVPRPFSHRSFSNSSPNLPMTSKLSAKQLLRRRSCSIDPMDISQKAISSGAAFYSRVVAQQIEKQTDPKK
eukprot:CAMPEP_0179425258 /NCGR_PEP_ID=MMETSP0799-20121207/12070_1 /TAXON_ID=46947 /ORGANISM="Geminigera cryophila, Strain CCMP2564" /LENGTH=475 /DNA_ID=CAMNT_0021199853 /DNA_START=29 /DNA_END=1456 /DNA_ORIENTATION=-